MSNLPRNLTRKQLAEFLPDARAVRAFEQLLKMVSDITPQNLATLLALIQDNSISTGTALSRSQEAVDLIATNDSDIGTLLSTLHARISALESWRDQDIIFPAKSDADSLDVDYIDFSTSAPSPVVKVGRAKWGPTGTLELFMGRGNITQQVGEEFFIYGKASSAITEGQPIMITGAVGASGAITFAPAIVGITDENLLVGVATENIPVNEFGRVTTHGVVRGINTTGGSVGEVWADGDVLWYNPAVAGAFTKFKPSAPNVKTQMAIINHAGPGNSGSLTVGIIHGSKLGDSDSNVKFTSLNQDDLIQYDVLLGYWRNAPAKMRIIASSAVAITAPNNLSENTLATVVIPAGAMGLDGVIRVRTSWSVTNGANGKSVRVRFGGVAYLATTVTTVATVAAETYVINRGVANSQVSNFIAGSAAPFGSSASSLITSTIDTAVDVSLALTAQKALATDVITLQSYTVELLTR